MARRFISSEEKLGAARAVLRGEKIAVLARETGISRPTLYALLKHALGSLRECFTYPSPKELVEKENRELKERIKFLEEKLGKSYELVGLSAQLSQCLAESDLPDVRPLECEACHGDRIWKNGSYAVRGPGDKTIRLTRFRCSRCGQRVYLVKKKRRSSSRGRG